MKKLMFTLAILILPVFALAGITTTHKKAVAQKRVAGGECAEAYTQTVGTTPFSGFNVSDKDRNGIKQTGTDTYTMCDITYKITTIAGDVSGKTYTAVVYSLSGNALDVLQGTSDGVAGSNSWSATEVKFTFSTPVSMIQNYVILIDQEGWDASNYVNLLGTTSGDQDAGFSNIQKYSAAGIRTDDQTTYDHFYRIGTQ